MKKMGYILIAVGVIIMIIGIVMVARPSNNTVVYNLFPQNSQSSAARQAPSHTDIASTAYRDRQQQMPAATPAPTAENASLTDPKQIGNAFENFIANLFADKSTFKVLEWNQGTTSTEGVYAENDKNPDFKINQTFKKSGLEYWVECKYRSQPDDGTILIKQYQLNRYRGIQRSSHIKIFVAIGVGGDPRNPDTLYIVPLDSIKDENILLAEISRFKINKTGRAFADYVSSYFSDHVFKKIPL